MREIHVFAHTLAVDYNFALGGDEKAAYTLHKHGFAAAVVAHYAVYLSLFKIAGDAVQHPLLPEVLG